MLQQTLSDKDILCTAPKNRKRQDLLCPEKKYDAKSIRKPKRTLLTKKKSLPLQAELLKFKRLEKKQDERERKLLDKTIKKLDRATDVRVYDSSAYQSSKVKRFVDIQILREQQERRERERAIQELVRKYVLAITI